MYPVRCLRKKLPVRCNFLQGICCTGDRGDQGRQEGRCHGCLAAEGEFGQDITMESWRTALKKVGFADMVEVAAGADMTAAYEAMEWAEAFKEGKKMTTSCCPAFVNMIKKHYPTLIDNMSTTVSPDVCGIQNVKKRSIRRPLPYLSDRVWQRSLRRLTSPSRTMQIMFLTFGEAIEMLRGKKLSLSRLRRQSRKAVSSENASAMAVA